MPLIYRNGKLFSVNLEYIKPESRTTATVNGLYAAIYDEFKGAVEKDKYKSLTAQQKMENLNSFAEKWLKDRGFYNG
jgi:hypothetical protein